MRYGTCNDEYSAKKKKIYKNLNILFKQNVYFTNLCQDIIHSFTGICIILS